MDTCLQEIRKVGETIDKKSIMTYYYSIIIQAHRMQGERHLVQSREHEEAKKSTRRIRCIAWCAKA